MVGKLLHLTHTQPNITYSVSVVSRFMSQPQVPHLQAVRRIFQYLSGTSDFGILFGREGTTVVTGYSDSDYTGDVESSRSTTGFIFCVEGSPITWFLKKQPTVALSSTEAEYRALSKAARETVWIRSLLGDLDASPTKPIQILCDNESSIKLAHNPVFHSRTKHITIHYHFTREKIESVDISVTYVSTGEQRADLLTKPLGRPLFEKFRDALKITSFTKASQQDSKSY
jgi:hypothetical protein